jgi:fructose-bisphosphate aldolase class 1
MGYNAVNIKVENNASGAAKMRAFTKAKNIFPTWEAEEYILHKSKYMQACMDAGVPMAPTIFAIKGSAVLLS